MSMSNPVYRAIVVYSNASTGQIIVRIPSLTGSDSTIELSTIGRKAVNGVWGVPSIGEQIVVTADDTNFTNTFWVQTDVGVAASWATTQTINAQIGTTYTPSALDLGRLVTLNNASAVTVTINTSLGLTAGQRIDFAQLGAGQVTFSASSTTVNGTPGLKLRARYSAATLICLSTNTYLLVGDLSA